MIEIENLRDKKESVSAKLSIFEIPGSNDMISILILQQIDNFLENIPVRYHTDMHFCESICFC